MLSGDVLCDVVCDIMCDGVFDGVNGGKGSGKAILCPRWLDNFGGAERARLYGALLSAIRRRASG